MLYQFSIAICPPPHILLQLYNMKLRLADRISWFHSKNSLAHLTFNIFISDEAELIIWKKFLASFTSEHYGFSVRFTKIAMFNGGSLVLLPDESSKKMLRSLMSQLHASVPFPAQMKNIVPHMTIGRGIKEADRPKAMQEFEHEVLDISFNVTDLTIRKFNMSRKQYDIESRYLLNGV